jgi:TolB-like protein
MNDNLVACQTVRRRRTSARARALLCALAVTVPARTIGQDMTPIAARLAPQLTASAKASVAVVDFTDLQMRVTELGRFLAEEFQAALVNAAKGFRVVDRTHLKAILQEHRLAASGVIDPQAARQLGKIAGVQALVTGSITPLGDIIRVSIKVLDTETAHVISMTTMDVPKTETLSLLVKQGPGNLPTAGDTPHSKDVGTSGATTPAKPLQTLTTSVHQFDLLGCSRRGTNVQCELRLTNLGKDNRYYCQDYDVRAYDQEGVEYRAISREIARSKDWVVLISGVPTPATMVFGNVPSTATGFSALFLNCSGGDVTFRKVPIR